MQVLVDAGAPSMMVPVRYLNIGHANMMLGNHGAARRCFERHLTAAKENNGPDEVGTAYSHLGSLALREGRFCNRSRSARARRCHLPAGGPGAPGRSHLRYRLRP